MRVVETFAAARALSGGSVGLVPTMGFLHEGHISLVRAAEHASDTVVVTLFVNPLQFEDQSDLDRYPRDIERDAALIEDAGADILVVPALHEMFPHYPTRPAVTVAVERITEGMEGEHRSGHFAGVATIVAKLFAGIRPDRAWFGRKDAQQFVVVSRLATDLSFPVTVTGGATVREADGLALSSRNVFLDHDDRVAAVSVSRGLFAAAAAAGEGERSADVLEGVVAAEIEAAGGAVDYVTLASASDCSALDSLDRSAFLAVAARVGQVRLIDNIWLEPDGSADRGICLTGPSILYGGD